MAFRTSHVVAIGLYASLCFACSSKEQEPTSAGSTPAPAPAAEHTDHPAQPGAEPAQVTPPAGAKVFFIEPKDGAEVSGPATDGKVTVHVKMGAEGITVQAAGQQVPGTGHHHIVVDGEPVPLGAVVPKDDTHVHFGQGQTEADLPLTPGEHTLTLQFADGAHLSYGPQLMSSIKVKVVEMPQAAHAKAGEAHKGKETKK